MGLSKGKQEGCGALVAQTTDISMFLLKMGHMYVEAI